MRPDFLAIGHATRDLLPDGFTLGGTVTYGAAMATKLGLRSAIVTSCGPDLDPALAFPGVQVHAVPAARTTSFTNVYNQGKRTQRVSDTAGPIAFSDVPHDWRSAPLVLLGPLIGEVGHGLAREFRDSLVVGPLQGWLRSLDSEGHVSMDRRNAAEEVLPYLDAAIISQEDVTDHVIIDRWKEMVPVLIVTLGQDGARTHFNGGWHEVEPYPVENERDPTGAGDVFAAAYLVRFADTGEPLESARFASSAASFSVEGVGLDRIPTRAQIEGRLTTAR